MDNSCWITDRRPTEADGDGDGDVRVRYSPDSNDYISLHWSHVGADVPWKHCTGWQPYAPAGAGAKPAIAVGQVWRRRDGEVVTIEKIDRDHRYGKTHPFWSRGDMYTPDGFWLSRESPNQRDLIELISEPAPKTPTAAPRRFVALTRTVHEFGHTLDAIDEDGVAWCMLLPALEPLDAEWDQVTPLPVREVEAN